MYRSTSFLIHMGDWLFIRTLISNVNHLHYEIQHNDPYDK
jgi:hypothetical protein